MVTTLEELDASFQAWVDRVCRLPSTPGPSGPRSIASCRAAPRSRFARPTRLRQAFLRAEQRTVTRTATLSFHGNRYAVDPLLAGQLTELRFGPSYRSFDLWRSGNFLARAPVQKLESPREVSLDRVPPSAVEAKPEHVDFLAALRAEHQTLLAQELGAISFAQMMRQETCRESSSAPTTDSTETLTPTGASSGRR